jgi:hypothetical protein
VESEFAERAERIRDPGAIPDLENRDWPTLSILAAQRAFAYVTI